MKAYRTEKLHRIRRMFDLDTRSRHLEQVRSVSCDEGKIRKASAWSKDPAASDWAVMAHLLIT
jgi:hypothetical protein